MPGDANADGQVDINDLTVVLANYNRMGGWSQGEFTGSGTVDINDLTIVLAHYGQTSIAGISAVPEPAGILLLAAGAFGLLACGGVAMAGKARFGCHWLGQCAGGGLIFRRVAQQRELFVRRSEATRGQHSQLPAVGGWPSRGGGPRGQSTSRGGWRRRRTWQIGGRCGTCTSPAICTR